MVPDGVEAKVVGEIRSMEAEAEQLERSLTLDADILARLPLARGLFIFPSCAILNGAQRVFDTLRQQLPDRPRRKRIASTQTGESMDWLDRFRLEADKLPGPSMEEAQVAARRALDLVTHVRHDFEAFRSLQLPNDVHAELKQRAARASMSEALAILSEVPDVEPAPGDELPEGGRE